MSPAAASIWITILACLLGAYFGACHVALKTFSRKKLADLLASKGKIHRLDHLVERLMRLQLITGAVRSTMGLIVLLAVLYGTRVRFPDWNQWVIYVVSLVIAGTLVSVFSVAIATSWARYQREQLIAWSVPILQALLWLFTPLVMLLHLADPVIRRIAGADRDLDTDSDISDEVLSVVEDHQDSETVDEEQKDMIEAVFELPSIDAGEIMTPRTDVVGLAADADLEQIKQHITEHGHSRVPVYEENLDSIAGILYVKDLIQYLGDGASFKLAEILRDPLHVPESKSVSALLTDFKSQKVHMAIVVDEYGGTAGLITIEDILEEIVGDIQDEYELHEEPEQFQRIDERTAEADARIYIDDLNDLFEIELPEDDDYDTLGGFVVATLGHIPETGESFDHEGLRFTVTAAERTKVLRVKVERVEIQSMTGTES